MSDNIFFSIAVRFIFIPLFWGFMFTWCMVKPPKEGRFADHITKNAQVVLWIVTAVLLLIDLFVLAPGIYLGG